MSKCSVSYEVRQLKSLAAKLGLKNAVKYRMATKLRVGSVKIEVHGFDVDVRPRTHDLTVALESLGSEFEDLHDYIDEHFEGLVVDAGGYIGTSAIKFSRMFPNATILTIEPSSANFDVLSRNISRTKNIIAIQCALTDEEAGEVALRDRGTGEWGLTIIPVDSETALSDLNFAEKVATVSLAQIRKMFPDQPIGMIKMDIEGAEKKLFDLAPDDLRAIPVIAVELHDKVVPGCRRSFEAFSKGRRVLKLGGESICHWRTDIDIFHA